MIPLLVARLIAQAFGDDMSDIQYLAIKEFDGKRVDVYNSSLLLNNTSTETDLVTKTADGGKDMYLAEASISGQVTGSNPLDGVTYRVFANGVEIDKFRIISPPFEDTWIHTFTAKSVKVTTGQIIKITAQNDNAGINVISTSQGKLILWQEDTGDTPQIPPLEPV